MPVLCRYAAAVSENRIDRGGILANTILPFLRREEVTPSPRADDELAKRQRQVLFGWWVSVERLSAPRPLADTFLCRLTTLTLELREMQPTHRGACLEAVAGIAERSVALLESPNVPCVLTRNLHQPLSVGNRASRRRDRSGSLPLCDRAGARLRD